MRFESAALAAFMAGGLVSAAASQNLNFTSITAQNYTSGHNVTIKWNTTYPSTSLKLFQQLGNGTWVNSTLANGNSETNTTYLWLAEPVDNSTSEAKNTTTYYFQLLNAQNASCSGCIFNSTNFSLLIENNSSSVPGGGGVATTHKSSSTSTSTHKSTSSSTSSTHKTTLTTSSTTTHKTTPPTTTHAALPTTSSHKTTTSFTTKTITLPRSSSSKEPQTSLAGPVSISQTPKATSKPTETETPVSKAASSLPASSSSQQQSLPAPIPVSHSTTRRTSSTNHLSTQTKLTTSTKHTTTTTHHTSKHTSTHHKTTYRVTSGSSPAAKFPTASLDSSLSSNGAALYHSVGLGVGLGLGAPVILGLLGCFGFCLRRRRRRRQEELRASKGMFDGVVISQPRYMSEKDAMRISALPLADSRSSQRSAGDSSRGPPPYLRDSQVSRETDDSRPSDFDPEAFNFDNPPETSDFTAQLSHTFNPGHRLHRGGDAASSRYSLDDLDSIAGGGQDLSTIAGGLPDEPPHTPPSPSSQHTPPSLPPPVAVHPALRPGPNFI